MLSGISVFYNRYVLGQPVYTLLILGIILAFFSWHVKDFKLDASADSLLLEDDRDLMVFRDLIDRYKTRDFLFLTFTPKEDLFSESSLATLKKLKTEVQKLPGVESVVTILDVPLVKQVQGSLSEVADNYRTLESKDVDLARAKQELLASPIYSQLVISLDGHTTAMQINLKDHPQFRELLKRKNDLLIKKNNSFLTAAEKKEYQDVQDKYETEKKRIDHDNHVNLERIREIMGHYRNFGSLHLGGVSMITDDMITYVKNDLIVFGLGVFLFLVIMLGIIFRRKRWVILPLASCLYSGVLMVGLLGFVGWQVTVISSNFISLMLINTMAMNIHLIVRYLQLRRDHPEYDQLELVRNTTEKMVWPCLYTALTTIMAFTSLVVSNIKPVIDFGWMMTIGLSVTFLTSFLLFPAILVLMSPTEVTHHRDDSFKFTAVLANITERYGNQVFLVSAMLAVIGVYGMTQLKVENSFINYFKQNTEIYQGLKLIDQKLGGTTPLDILLHFPPENEGNTDQTDDSSGDDDFDFSFGNLPQQNPEDYWFTPHKLDEIARVHKYLEGLEPVGKVLSLDSLMQVGEDLNKGKFDAFELAIVNKRMPEELKETMIRPYVSIPDNEARINLRIKDSQPGLHRNELLHKIHDDLINKLGLSPQSFQITGIMVLYNNMLQSLFSSQIQTLGVVMAGIAIMLLVLFRSVSLAVIGIIPNLLAAGIILGLMGLLNIPLDMMTITIASITLGIAVDNSIHYIYRFREEYEHRGDYLKTMHYCHAHIGNAVFYTAITIIIGFSILVFSNFIPTIYFGLFTALAMLIALLAALTLLPRLILFWRPF